MKILMEIVKSVTVFLLVNLLIKFLGGSIKAKWATQGCRSLKCSIPGLGASLKGATFVTVTATSIQQGTKSYLCPQLTT